MMEITQIHNDFKHHGPREQIDGVVIHAMAKYFHRSLLLQQPYNISPSLVNELPEVVFAPDFLEFVGRHAPAGWLKGSADMFVERHGIGYRWGYDLQTWHAGKSEWKHWHNLNRNFAGIECLVGAVPFDDYGQFVRAMNQDTQLYTPEMYATLAHELRSLVNDHNLDLDNIVTHEMVAGDDVRGKGMGKPDCGRMFDLEGLKRMI